MNIKQFYAVRKKCIAAAKLKIKESVSSDNYIAQAVSCIEDLDKVINKIVTRLREWYELYNPEFSRSVGNNEMFVELVIKKDKKTLQKEIGIHYAEQSMGKDIKKTDLDAIIMLAKQAREIVELREKEKRYLEGILEKHAPNLKAVLGSSLAGKMIRHMGSLRKIALTPATVLQIIGAEKALFRHMKSKSKCPKYGIIFAHSLFGKIKKSNHGKLARAIGDKAAVCARVDFFKGKFVGDKVRKELEKKAKQLM